MNLLQIIFEALDSLYSNTLRSLLTILGIVIGVGAVIAMLALGRGANDYIAASINGIGTNVLYVYPGNQSSNDNVSKSGRAVTMNDAKAFSDQSAAPAVAAVAPMLQDNSSEAAAQGQTTITTVNGVTPIYESVRNATVAEGEFITNEQYLSHASVAVIGPDLANTLFGRTDNLVGEPIRLAGQPFKVIGVLAKKGGSVFGNADNQVIIPITTARDRVRHKNGNDVDTIFVQAVSAAATSTAAVEIKLIMEARHHIPAGKDDDFTVFTQVGLLQTASSITGLLTIVLGGIAGISLLVGGIGIMNIMLVSVTERTQEIGLRKALGARKADILTQFLAESALLSFLGGLIGILRGWSLSYVVGKIAATMGIEFTPSITIGSVFLATIFSAGIGIFFGIYPANRAARMQPVDALRYQ